jgi:hypothetical protein
LKFLELNVKVAQVDGGAGDLADEIKRLGEKYDIAEKEGEGGDTCPACGAGIGFGELGMARCAKGHEWGECNLQIWLIALTVMV